MGLGSTGLDAQPYAGAISCQIEPQEIRTDSHCTVRLRTWGRNTSPPATSLSPFSSSKHETKCAQQIITNPVITVPKAKTQWASQTFDDTTSSQQPDGLIEDTKLKHIYIIEVARTHDSLDSLSTAHVKKMCTYNSLLHALRKAFPQYVVKQQNYVIGCENGLDR